MDVTVKLRVTAVHEPGSPQSAGGLAYNSFKVSVRSSNNSRVVNNLGANIVGKVMDSLAGKMGATTHSP